MNSNTRPAGPAQLRMPGMPATNSMSEVASCCTVEPGTQVLYVGKVGGGPRYGARGVVKTALNRKAVVDMGRMGTWHVPYYFLGIAEAA